MAGKGKKELIYEGFTLPRLKIKEILASNARRAFELKNLHKQLDKEKEELETDFSKTRSQLLSRALDHQMVLEGQSYDDSSSDEEHLASEFENSADNYITSWETTPFSTLKDISTSQGVVEENFNIHPSNPKDKQPIADKIAHLAAKNKPVTPKSQPKRKISWGGRANPSLQNWEAVSQVSEHLAAKNEVDTSKSKPKRKISWAGRSKAYMENWEGDSECSEQYSATKSKPDVFKSQHRRHISWGGRGNVHAENWDARSELSKASSEGNLSSQMTCPVVSHPRERKHTVSGRSRGLSRKSSVLTKEALQKHSFSTNKHLTRRHTVCCRPRPDQLSPTVEENCPEQKPLSELLAPTKLPPIYLQETKSKNQRTKRDKNFVNKHVEIGINKSVDTTRDLKYCRYLRIKGTEEYPW